MSSVNIPFKSNLFNSSDFKSSNFKQYLTHAYTKNNNQLIDSEKKLMTKFRINLSNYKEINENPRLNSESSLNSNNTICNANLLGNKERITLSLKHLKFQKSSLDHQRYCFEKLYLSKAKSFCIAVSFDKKKEMVF